MALIKTSVFTYANSLSTPSYRPCHSLFFSRDHLRSPSGIISGPGSFAVQFGDHLRSGIICKELWLVQENRATVKLDSSVASHGMKTCSESRIELRNLQILKKMLEKSSQFLSSEQLWEPESLDVALNIAGAEKYAGKTCGCGRGGPAPGLRSIWRGNPKTLTPGPRTTYGPVHGLPLRTPLRTTPKLEWKKTKQNKKKQKKEIFQLWVV